MLCREFWLEPEGSKWNNSKLEEILLLLKVRDLQSPD